MAEEAQDSLTGTQRKFLRGLAHGLKPVVHIGKAGLSEGLFENLEQALESHELIKVKFHDFKDQKNTLSDEVAARLDCEAVGKVGHTVVFFRQARVPEHRKIRLP